MLLGLTIMINNPVVTTYDELQFVIISEVLISFLIRYIFQFLTKNISRQQTILTCSFILMIRRYWCRILLRTRKYWCRNLLKTRHFWCRNLLTTRHYWCRNMSSWNEL